MLFFFDYKIEIVSIDKHIWLSSWPYLILLGILALCIEILFILSKFIKFIGKVLGSGKRSMDCARNVMKSFIRIENVIIGHFFRPNFLFCKITLKMVHIYLGHETRFAQ